MFKPIYYRTETKQDSEKVPGKLFVELEKISEFIARRFNSKNQILMRLTEEEEFNFQSTEICQICGKEFKNDESDNTEFYESFYESVYYLDDPVYKYKKVRCPTWGTKG